MILSLHNLGLAPAEFKAIQRKAKKAGKTTTEYVRLLIARDLLSDQSFDELLAPIRDDFQKSDISGQQLTAIVDRARKATTKKSRP